MAPEPGTIAYAQEQRRRERKLQAHAAEVLGRGGGCGLSEPPPKTSETSAKTGLNLSQTKAKDIDKLEDETTHGGTTTYDETTTTATSERPRPGSRQSSWEVGTIDAAAVDDGGAAGDPAKRDNDSDRAAVSSSSSHDERCQRDLSLDSVRSDDDSEDDQDDLDGGSRSPSSSSSPPAVEVEMPEVVAGAPQGSRWSPGCAQHSTGMCKPCFFFAMSVGCRNGSSCSFCHLDHGEVDLDAVRRRAIDRRRLAASSQERMVKPHNVRRPLKMSL